MGDVIRRRAAWWTACLLLVGLLAEGAALLRAERPGAVMAAVRRLTTPACQLLHPFGLSPELPEAALPSTELPGTEAASAVCLDVENILQLPNLPNGCEVTSLAMVLRWMGYSVTGGYLAGHCMPQGWLYPNDYLGITYADDPAACFVGDPFSEYGYYMLAPALVQTANNYLAGQGGVCVAADVSGASETELEALLRGGTPVIVWATKEYDGARYGSPWILVSSGQPYWPYMNLHCRVLVGADEQAFYVNDPLYGAWQAVPREQFMQGYRALGCQAAIVTRRTHIPGPVVIGTAR